jgi:hypothetical protein
VVVVVSDVATTGNADAEIDVDDVLDVGVPFNAAGTCVEAGSDRDVLVAAEGNDVADSGEKVDGVAIALDLRGTLVHLKP